MDRKKLIKHLIYLLLFIFIANFLANKFYWYYTIWYFDMVMHFLGGFWIGLLYFYLFSIKEKSLGSFIKALFFVLFVGIGWEVYEILVNSVIAQNPFDYLDTSSDVFFDLLGGAASTFYVFRKIMIANINKV